MSLFLHITDICATGVCVRVYVRSIIAQQETSISSE